MVLELTLLPLFVDKTRKYRYVSGDLYARHCVRFFTNVISFAFTILGIIPPILQMRR